MEEENKNLLDGYDTNVDGDIEYSDGVKVELKEKEEVIPLVDEKIKNRINLPPSFTQQILYKLGQYCSTNLGNDYYYFNQAVQMLVRGGFGEEWMAKNYPNWEQTKKKLNILSVRLAQIKTSYDYLERKDIDKGTRDKRMREHLKLVSKIALLQQEMFDVFWFLHRRTNLVNKEIPSQAFKILEHTKRQPLEMAKKKEETVSRTPEHEQT